MVLLVGIVAGVHRPRRSTTTATPRRASSSPVLIAAGVLGNLVVLPIGGADMPVVISLLNALTGLSAAAAGFALDNVALIVAGTLVGSSGTLLTMEMATAMNRSVPNILFAGFGGAPVGRRRARARSARTGRSPPRTRRSRSPTPTRVVIVPGYGLAVAQAQHAVKEMADELEKRGVEVRYAIHPVAGRMPGHMNVLLAEADVPYEKLVEMEDINPDMPRTDVAVVIGANDVTNPAAKNDPDSPIAGHADHRGRRGPAGDRHQALDEPRLRRHRQRPLLPRQDRDALRRRQEGGAGDRLRDHQLCSCRFRRFRPRFRLRSHGDAVTKPIESDECSEVRGRPALTEVESWIGWRVDDVNGSADRPGRVDPPGAVTDDRRWLVDQRVPLRRGPPLHDPGAGCRRRLRSRLVAASAASGSGRRRRSSARGFTPQADRRLLTSHYARAKSRSRAA